MSGPLVTPVILLDVDDGGGWVAASASLLTVLARGGWLLSRVAEVLDRLRCFFAGGDRSFALLVEAPPSAVPFAVAAPLPSPSVGGFFFTLFVPLGGPL